MATTSSIPTVNKGISDPKVVDFESHRLREAQELLRSIQMLVTEEEVPNIELIADGLLKAEQFTLRARNQPDLDPQTLKTIEDISALLVSARQLGRNKQIADRLQKISDEAEMALKEARVPNVSAAAKEASQNLQDFTDNWRPLFYLLMSSREFRQLIIDANRIVKRVVYSYSEDIKDESNLTHKFADGAPAQDIADTITIKARQMGVPELSDEEWRTLQDDVQRVLAVLAKDPIYRDGIERIFFLLDTFQKNLIQDSLPMEGLPRDMHLRRVVAETEDLVACFSGRETLESFKTHLRQLILQIQKNQNLQYYLSELKEFILKAKSEQEVQSEEFKTRSKELAHRGRELMRELRDDADLYPFLKSADEMIQNIKNDEFLSILRQHAGIVQSDLSYVDSQGELQVDTDMLSKLQSALLPALVDALKYLPIPKIYSNDHEREFWLDKVVLCSYDIIPQNIKFHLESDSQISLPDIRTSTRTHLVIKLEKLLTELKDIEFYYRKKTFPKIEDHGRVTFRIKGNGAKLTFIYTLIQGPNDAVPRIRGGYANFDLSNMEIVFDKSTLKHPLMVPMFTEMFKSEIRMEIELQVEKNLMGFLEKLGEKMTHTLNEVNRPFHYGLETAKKVVKSSQLTQVCEKRREKLGHVKKDRSVHAKQSLKDNVEYAKVRLANEATLAKEGIKKNAEHAKDRAFEAKESLKDNAEHTKLGLVEVANWAKEAIKDNGDYSNDRLAEKAKREENAEFVKDHAVDDPFVNGANCYNEEINENAEYAKDTTFEFKENLKDNSEYTTDPLVNDANWDQDEIKDNVEYAKDPFSNDANWAKEEIKESAEYPKDRTFEFKESLNDNSGYAINPLVNEANWDQDEIKDNVEYTKDPFVNDANWAKEEIKESAEYAKDPMFEFKESLKDNSENATDPLANNLEYVQDRAVDATESPKDNVEYTNDPLVPENAEYAKDPLTGVATWAIEEIKQKAEHAKDPLTGVATWAIEEIKQKAEHAKDPAAGVAEWAKEEIRENAAKETLKDIAEYAKDNLECNVVNVQDHIVDITESPKDNSESAKDSLANDANWDKENAEHAKDPLTGVATWAIEEIKQKAEHAKDPAAGVAEWAKEEIKENAEHANDVVEDIDDNPNESVLVDDFLANYKATASKSAHNAEKNPEEVATDQKPGFFSNIAENFTHAKDVIVATLIPAAFQPEQQPKIEEVNK